MVESLNGVQSIFLDGFQGTSSRAVEGYALGTLWGGKWERDSSGNLALDANGFPIAAANEGVLGNPNPSWRAGLGANASYKGFSMNVLFETSQGNQMWAGTYGVLNHFGINPETANEVTVSAADAAIIKDIDGQSIASSATPDANGMYTVRGNIEDFGKGKVWLNQGWYQTLGGGFGPVAEQFIKDASWVRLRELTLNYDLPVSICKAMHIPGVSLGFTGRNLALWTSFDGLDPETNLTGVTNGRGLDYFTNPGTKSFIFNLKIKI